MQNLIDCSASRHGISGEMSFINPDDEEFFDTLHGPHTMLIEESDGSHRVVHCTKSIEECESCEFRIDSFVNEECIRKLRR